MDLGIGGRTAVVCASSRGLGKACHWVCPPQHVGLSAFSKALSVEVARDNVTRPAWHAPGTLDWAV